MKTDEENHVKKTNVFEANNHEKSRKKFNYQQSLYMTKMNKKAL